MSDLEARRRQLERELADLERRLPAHSVPPSMLLRWEEIADELARLRQLEEADRCQRP